ncbi:MAG: rhodanese-like domain-containing protein [Cellulophaga sp.]
MKDLTQEVWKEQVFNDKDAIIIDVRRPEEWETGIIESAVMMNVMDFEGFKRKASQLDSNKNYYLYCRSGARSIKACQALETLALDKTYNLLGGILEWKDEIVNPNNIK